MNEADWEMGSELGLRSLRLAARGVVSGLGEVAQLVEHTTENRGVAGSNPALATAEKPGGKRCDGRFPPSPMGRLDGGFRAHNPKVAGSNPAPAISLKGPHMRGFRRS